jgi:hypothetical protein
LQFSEVGEAFKQLDLPNSNKLDQLSEEMVLMLKQIRRVCTSEDISDACIAARRDANDVQGATQGSQGNGTSIRRAHENAQKIPKLIFDIAALEESFDDAMNLVEALFDLCLSLGDDIAFDEIIQSKDEDICALAKAGLAPEAEEVQKKKREIAKLLTQKKGRLSSIRALKSDCDFFSELENGFGPFVEFLSSFSNFVTKLSVNELLLFRKMSSQTLNTMLLFPDWIVGLDPEIIESLRGIKAEQFILGKRLIKNEGLMGSVRKFFGDFGDSYLFLDALRSIVKTSPIPTFIKPKLGEESDIFDPEQCGELRLYNHQLSETCFDFVRSAVLSSVPCKSCRDLIRTFLENLCRFTRPEDHYAQISEVFELVFSAGMLYSGAFSAAHPAGGEISRLRAAMGTLDQKLNKDEESVKGVFTLGFLHGLYLKANPLELSFELPRLALYHLSEKVAAWIAKGEGVQEFEAFYRKFYDARGEDAPKKLTDVVTFAVANYLAPDSDRLSDPKIEKVAVPLPYLAAVAPRRDDLNRQLLLLLGSTEEYRIALEMVNQTTLFATTNYSRAIVPLGTFPKGTSFGEVNRNMSPPYDIGLTKRWVSLKAKSIERLEAEKHELLLAQEKRKLSRAQQQRLQRIDEELYLEQPENRKRTLTAHTFGFGYSGIGDRGDGPGPIPASPAITAWPILKPASFERQVLYVARGTARLLMQNPQALQPSLAQKLEPNVRLKDVISQGFYITLASLSPWSIHGGLGVFPNPAVVNPLAWPNLEYMYWVGADGVALNTTHKTRIIDRLAATFNRFCDKTGLGIQVLCEFGKTQEQVLHMQATYKAVFDLLGGAAGPRYPVFEAQFCKSEPDGLTHSIIMNRRIRINNSARACRCWLLSALCMSEENTARLFNSLGIAREYFVTRCNQYPGSQFDLRSAEEKERIIEKIMGSSLEKVTDVAVKEGGMRSMDDPNTYKWSLCLATGNLFQGIGPWRRGVNGFGSGAETRTLKTSVAQMLFTSEYLLDEWESYLKDALEQPKIFLARQADQPLPIFQEALLTGSAKHPLFSETREFIEAEVPLEGRYQRLAICGDALSNRKVRYIYNRGGAHYEAFPSIYDIYYVSASIRGIEVDGVQDGYTSLPVS